MTLAGAFKLSGQPTLRSSDSPTTSPGRVPAAAPSSTVTSSEETLQETVDRKQEVPHVDDSSQQGNADGSLISHLSIRRTLPFLLMLTCNVRVQMDESQANT